MTRHLARQRSFLFATLASCAALATVLNYSAATTTPEDLAHEVYIPGRKGSLQIEMLAAARNRLAGAQVSAPLGRVPVALEVLR